MGKLQQGWRIQVRVIGALMIREINTRFGRENIGFLWIMAEPMLFGILVSLVWRLVKGPEEHGVGVVSFVITGYLPLVMFRNSVSRCVGLFEANGGLMYHRQISLTDFVLARFLVENIGHMMAYLFVGIALIVVGQFPVPAHIGWIIAGWLLYSLFTMALCMILAPLSARSEVIEKIMPVTTYIMIPFSGTFVMMSWLTPGIRAFLDYSPLANAMEMMRYGVYGNSVSPIFSFFHSSMIVMVMWVIGLHTCRTLRKTLVVS